MAKQSTGFSDEEKAAMRERVKEMKASASKAELERAVVAKIAGFSEPDRSMAKKVHSIVKANAPGLLAKLWYGMPAYAHGDGKIVCFFQDAKKFGNRYATLGFTTHAHLDVGNMWPNGYALMKLTSAEEKRIAELVRRAVA